jgi:hypothetical protein
MEVAEIIVFIVNGTSTLYFRDTVLKDATVIIAKHMPLIEGGCNGQHQRN